MTTRGADFLDTDILAYAYDVRLPAKQRIAQAMVRRACAGEFVISTQVLAEFAAMLLQRFEPQSPPAT